MRGALDWSYELLSEDEKRSFARLSVFSGGWTLGAAEAVGSGGGIEEGDVLEQLSGLADRSLVVVETADDGARYRFLEPVRQYARDKLEESQEAEDTRRRHAGYFHALAKEGEQGLRGPAQASWFRRLDAELDNLRAAFSWSLERDEPTLLVEAAAALLFFWSWKRYLHEARRWLEEGLGRVGAPSPVRAKALIAVGDLALIQGDFARSRESLEESLSLYRAAGDDAGIAACLSDLGWLATFQGDFARATPLLEKSAALARKLGDDWRLAFALNRLADIEISHRNSQRAITLLEENLALYRRIGDSRAGAMCLYMMGFAVLTEGKAPGRAARLIEESFELIRAAGLTPFAQAIFNLATAAQWQGEFERATKLIARGFERSQSYGSKIETMQGLEAAAALAATQGHNEKAATLWGAAEALGVALDSPIPPDELAVHGSAIDAARSELGEEAWKRAHQRGQELTVEEAVEHALSENVPSTMPGEPAPPQATGSTSVLTRREKEVAGLVARGLSNARIASELFISERTAENHVARILKKLGLRSREQVATRLRES